MRRFRFPLAVLGTSVALVAVLVLAGGFLVGNTLAAGLTGWGHAGGPFNGDLPAQLSGLRDVPAGERFAHFRGVQLTLTDKNNQPLAITATPGTVASANANSLTLTGNDGSSHTYTLDGQTILHGRAAQPALAQGQQVVVATLNGSQTAFAVVAADQHGPFGH